MKKFLVLLLKIGIPVAILAYLFWDVAMRKGDLLFVAAGSYFTPLLSTLVACLYLRVSPGISLWVGCVFIVGGAFLSHRGVTSELST